MIGPLVVVVLLVVPSVWSEPGVSQAKVVERVEVIGSRVKTIRTEGSTSVQAINKKTIEVSANATVGEALRDSASTSDGASQSPTSGVSTVGLRGLGASRTLVLLNGHRLPTDPSRDAVDINWIPAAAIERIEILKESASAMYGSDAMGGVINIITKKSFTGSEAFVKLAAAEKAGGNSYTVSTVTGTTTEKHDLNLSLGYTFNEKILGRDREITRNGISTTGPATAWKGVGQNDFTVPHPNDCPADQVKTLTGGQRCTYKYNDIATSRPSVSQFNLLSDYTLRMDSGLKFYNRNLLLYRETQWNYAPLPINMTEGLESGIPSNTNVRNLSFRSVEAGNRDNRDPETNIYTMFGFKDNLTDTTEYDLSFSYGFIDQKSHGYGGYINETTLRNLITSGAYDPLKPVGSRGDITPAKMDVNGLAQQTLLSTDLVVNGEFSAVGMDTIGYALGGSVMSDSQRYYFDDTGDGTIDNRGSRTIQSVFSEVVLPVTEKLEFDLAARYDHYSDFGSTVNPKLSSKYMLTDKALLRAAVGTGFKAPVYSRLYGKVQKGLTDVIDRKYCAEHPNQVCETTEASYTLNANPNLKEEKSIFYTVGTAIEVNPDTTLSVDYWYTKANSIVIEPDLELATRAELQGVNLRDYGIQITRDATGAISHIEYSYSNLSSSELSGLDLNLDYYMARISEWAGYKTSFSNELSYMFYNRDESFPGTGSKNMIGDWGYPHFKNRASLSMRDDINMFEIVLRSIPGQSVADIEANRKISDLNEFDFNYSHKFEPKVSLGLGIKNLFDSVPPADKGGGIGGADVVNESLYDINGRRFFAAFSYGF